MIGIVNMFIHNRRKLVLVLILIQTSLLFFLYLIKVSIGYQEQIDKSIVMYISLISVVGIFLCIISIILIWNFIKFLDKDNEKEIKKLEFEKIESINFILREQLHDIKNHLQVTLGFIQLKKYNLAENYVKRIMKEQSSNIKEVEKLKVPEDIKILLSSKMAYAENHGIKFDIEIKATINSYNIDTFNLTKILSNMLMNAFFAAQNAGDKSYVSLFMWEENGLNIQVKNNGDAIPEGIKNKIFKPGFTTKGERGDGMGLYIVKKLINKYKGKINLTKSAEETIFMINFPESLKTVK